MDSTLDYGILLEKICADATLGVVYGIANEGLFVSSEYGAENTWSLRSGGISGLSSGRTEGHVYNKMIQHSEDFGVNFIYHSNNGYFGSFISSEIDNQDNIGYALVYQDGTIDSLCIQISYDNYENFEIQNVFNSNITPLGLLTRGFHSGELFSLGGYYNELYYSNNYGNAWVYKNTFNCPNLPIYGIVGGRQPGELYMLVTYNQLMGSVRHVYIYHSLDYGETFAVYPILEYGSDPYFADFIATLIQATHH